MAQTIWEVLGISPTSDQKEIKRAYARKCAECHPEEHPEEFDLLHKAYTAALKAAKREGAGQVVVERTPEVVTKKVCEEDIHEGIHEGQVHEESHPHQHKPSEEESPSVSQLVEKGLEQEKASAADKLMERFLKLHASFPKTVNTNDEELMKAFERLEEFFLSPRFQMAGWEPGFLKQLDLWLSKNRNNVNRAEAAALYKVYRMKQFKTPSYPAVPCLSNIYREVMQMASRYEKDMVRLAGMPPLVPLQTNKTASNTRHSRQRFQYSVPVVIMMTCIYIFISIGRQSNTAPSPPYNDMQKIQLEMLKNSTREVTAPSYQSPDLSEIDAILTQAQTSDTSPSSWTYNGWDAVDRNESAPVSCEEYEYYGKNQLTTAYGVPYAKYDYINAAVGPVSAAMNSVIDISVDPSYLDQENEQNGEYYYEMKALGHAPVSFPVWVAPRKNSGETSSIIYTVKGNGYWAETFLFAASKQGIGGRTWYDENHKSHLVLTWDSIERVAELSQRLLEASGQYYEYVKEVPSPMDIIILIGPGADQALDELQALQKPDADQRTLITLTEARQLERCGSGPLPVSGGYDSDTQPEDLDLSSLDSSVLWLTRFHMTEDGADGSFYPGQTPEEVLKMMSEHINGLDWILSRFEIKAVP